MLINFVICADCKYKQAEEILNYFSEKLEDIDIINFSVVVEKSYKNGIKICLTFTNLKSK